MATFASKICVAEKSSGPHLDPPLLPLVRNLGKPARCTVSMKNKVTITTWSSWSGKRCLNMALTGRRAESTKQNNGGSWKRQAHVLVAPEFLPRNLDG